MARKRNLGRRSVLKGTAGFAGAAIGSGAITGFPVIWAQNNKNIVLRQCGTGVSAINEIAEKCKADLGITRSVEYLGSTVQVGIDVAGLETLSAVVPEARFDANPVAPGQPVVLSWTPKDVHVLGR